jgi:hypothetical protein
MSSEKFGKIIERLRAREDRNIRRMDAISPRMGIDAGGLQ